MQNEVFVANQSLQELRNLRQVIEDLVILGQAKNKFAKELIALENKEQLQKIEMQQLKFILSIKLQKLLITLNLGRYSTNAINCTYDKIIEIQEEIDSKLHINEKILHLKIIQTLLDYKICEKYGIQQNFYFQQLLPIIQQHHQFQKIYSKKDEQYEMFFLGLLVEFIQKKQIEDYLEMHYLTINYLKQKLEKLKKQHKIIGNELIVKQLRILLSLHLSFKLLKKQLKFQQRNDEQNIYVLLYDLDYAITQKLTIQFKRYYGKTEIEAVNFVVSRIKTFIVDLQTGLNFDNELLQTRKNKKLSQFRIKRSSASLNQLKQKASIQKTRSLKKIDQKPIQIKNGMFIPQKVNANKKLQHKIQFKAQKNKLKISKRPLQQEISLKSIKNLQPKQSSREVEIGVKMQFTMSKDQILQQHSKANPSQSNINPSKQQKLSYSHCIKNIITVNQQLQYMLCQRVSSKIDRISLVDKNKEQIGHSRLIISRKNRSKLSSNNKKVSNNYSSIKSSEDKVNSIYQLKHNHSSLYVPPLIKKNLYKYIKSLIVSIYYKQKRKEIPFFSQLISLNPSKYYYLFGNIYKFASIKEQNLVFEISFLLNNKQQRKTSIDIKELATKEKIKSLFLFKKVIKHMFELFYLGKEIILFKLNLKQPFIEQQHIKYGINTIKYEYQIYNYNVYLNTNHISTAIAIKILKEQQTYMGNINKQLEIKFDYNQQIENKQIVPQKLKDSNEMKFYQFFGQKCTKYDHNLILVQSQKKSLKFHKIFTIFTIKLFKCLNRQKYYLVLQNNAKSKTVIACKKISISLVFKQVRTVLSLKKELIDQDKICYQCWNDVILNRAILDPPMKKYCVRNTNDNCYTIFYSKLLIESQIKLIYGHQKDFRWFMIISLLQIEPIWLRSIPSRDRKIKSAKSMKLSRKQIKGHDIGIELCLMQHFKNAKITPPQIYFNKQTYNYFRYEHHWIYYQNNRLHFCFKNQSKIIYFTILRKQLMYVNSMKINPINTQDEMFKEFKDKIEINYKILKVVLFDQIVRIQCEKNKLLCTFEFQDMDYMIQIDKSEMTLFYQDEFMITEKLLHRKSFQNRLIRIIKEKIYELNSQKF